MLHTQNSIYCLSDIQKTWKNGEAAIGEKPEECAIIEAKRWEYFKKDWLKLYNGHEENLSIKFKQQKGCTGTF